MKINEAFFEFLSGFRALTNTHTIFRWADESKNALAPKHCFHTSEFCTVVKSDVELFKKCRKECAQNTLEKAKLSNVPFIKRCHANVTEIVFPLYSSGIYQGCFCIGPYKTRKYKTYKTAESKYMKLPEFSNQYQAGVSSLLTSFSLFLLNESEKILLSTAARGAGDEKIRKALSLINSNLNSKLSADFLSKECGLSTSRFIHLFKEKTGYSLTDYIVKTRLEKAKTMLSSKTMKINEVAQECGYPNQNYFSLAFKKYTGMNPTEYKNNITLQP
ncbi:MAG: hypothetical protein A2044_05480 [Candidatus Firestonebacteria bacterium GWA2_43_8]|nr:MAG: hypothetical protein A2044_05480 [Candidatus Firestonebacteria bacterium GWA2_43_8]